MIRSISLSNKSRVRRAAMQKNVTGRIREKVETEPFAGKLGLKVVALEPGYSKVEMKVSPEMANIFGATHGGAILSLIDEAFETASNSHGVLAVALNVNIQYLRPAGKGDLLTAEAREVSRSKRISTNQIDVKNAAGRQIAGAQCMAFIKGDKLPFLE
ncbi:MAG: hotdog fold thioesterase [Smithella sp.]